MSAITGPWAYDADDRVIVKKDCFDIAFMSNDVTDEYALLIAAAPELLEALINLERTSGIGFMLNDPERVAARAAIAKATGAE